jgi:hypothetical protein
MSEREVRLEQALRKIVESRDHISGPIDGEYDLGSQDAWEAAAEIAIEALADPSAAKASIPS